MDYKSVIESRYNREAWEALLHDIFLSGANFRTTPIPVDAHSPLVSESLQLGTITLKDDNKIAVYEIKLSNSVDIVENRVGIRNLLFSDWKFKGCAGAFIFCYRDNESVLRFSYVSQIFAFGEDGKMAKEETDTKRFTYILGEGHRSRTAIGQFENLKSSSQTLKDLTKAFSLDAVSDRFFDDYKEVYEDIVEYVTGKRYVKVANKWEEKVIHAPNEILMSEFSWYEDPEKTVRDYVKRLMSRIVFLQFIQKKGWLGVPVNKEWGEGDKEFLQHLYEKYENKDNFIDGILELLFEDINHKRENDIANFILGRNIKVPYLNGGLFERDSVDERSFRLPRTLMDKMMSFFSSYNFTIDENDPDDAEIGVDPEMLGRIFENLLEDNKDKGAFYTPKEIVQYMCQESLIAFLQKGKSDTDAEAIRTFVTTYDASVLSDGLKLDVDTKLKDVKICDPAIGSGAFPMGLLKELFTCRSAIEGLSKDSATEIKKHIIQNNIYGVDIEKGAVEIARLRFWLSLIVDEKAPHSLPNMDFKIVQGNSLVPTFKGKYINLTDKSRHVNSAKIKDCKQRLYSLQRTYFTAESENKKELLIKIKYLILEIVKLQMDFEHRLEIQNSAQTMNMFGESKKEADIDEEKSLIIDECVELQNYLTCENNTLQERAALDLPFFDWQIIFPEVFNVLDNTGFDIVIGNPPYVSAVNMARSEFEKKLYRQYYPEATGAYDLYVLFLLLGVKLSRNVYTWIIPNKLLIADYAKKTKTRLINNEGLSETVDVSVYDVFKTASVYPIIILGKKNTPNQYVEYELEKYENLLNRKFYPRTKSNISNSSSISELGIGTCSGATGFEAQTIKELICETASETTIPFTVSGNIDRYCYNNINVRYMKGRYNPAYIKLNSKIAATKISMWKSPKIVIAGMTKCIEAVYVEKPLAIGVGVYAIYDFNGYDPYFLLGVLNAKATTDYLIKEFSDKHLAGGYLAINKSTIDQLPIPKVVPPEVHNRISSLARHIQDLKFTSPLENTITMEEEIDQLVSELITQQ